MAEPFKKRSVYDVLREAKAAPKPAGAIAKPPAIATDASLPAASAVTAQPAPSRRKSAQWEAPSSPSYSNRSP